MGRLPCERCPPKGPYIHTSLFGGTETAPAKAAGSMAQRLAPRGMVAKNERKRELFLMGRFGGHRFRGVLCPPTTSAGSKSNSEPSGAVIQALEFTTATVMAALNCWRESCAACRLLVSIARAQLGGIQRPNIRSDKTGSVSEPRGLSCQKSSCKTWQRACLAKAMTWLQIDTFIHPSEKYKQYPHVSMAKCSL